MGLESATYIDGLVVTNPVGSDDRSTADDHIRLIKAVLKSTFPNADGAYSFTDTEANLLVGLSATSTELNKLDGFTGVTADLELLAGVAAGAELTLGILGVDNITINGNSISSVGDLNLQPDAGNQIVLDGTIQVDAGVVTGATSISSTNFEGILGAVSPAAATVTTFTSTGIDDNASSTAVTIDSANKVILTAGLDLETFSEDDGSYTVTSGTKALDLSTATYFYPTSAMTATTYTFEFNNPAANGRVTSFTLELNDAATATTINWPAGIDWPGGSIPTWTTGIDIVSFVTRDGGTTWYGFLGGQDFS